MQFGLSNMRVVRIALLAATLFIVWSSAVESVTQITRVKNFEIALRFSPNDPGALTSKANSLLAKNKTNAKSLAQMSELVRIALAHQAIQSTALRTMLFAGASKRDRPWQLKVAQLAGWTSRRDFGMYVWFIEDRATHDDVRGALKQYDLAFHTSPESIGILYPQLLIGLSSPEIRAAFLPYVRKKPAWMVPFLTYAIGKSTDPSSIAEIIKNAQGEIGRSVRGNVEKGLLDSLISSRKFADAKSLYLHFRDADRSLLSSPRLTNASTSGLFSVMGWQPSNSTSAGVSFRTAEAATPVMEVYAGAGDRQVVARKLLFLARGPHNFLVRYGHVNFPFGSGMVWYLRCTAAHDLPVAWKSDFFAVKPNSPYHAVIEIPSGCDSQYLEAEMAGGEARAGVEAEVTEIELSHF